MPLHEKHLRWLETERGINAELAVKLGLFTKSDGGKLWLGLPYVEMGQVVNHKYRLATDKRSMLMDEGAPLILYNHDALLDDSLASKPLIITEGEFDAMAAMEAGHFRVVSVPNGAQGRETPDDALIEAKRYSWYWRHRDALDRVDRVIIASDGDEAGKCLLSDLARLFGPERCLFVEYPEGTKDLNDVLVKHGPLGVSKVIADAKPYPVRGLYSISDFPDPPALRTYSHRVPGLDEMLPIVPGSFTICSGFAGQGKTSLIMKIVANLLKSSVPVCMASFETMVRPILHRKLRASIVECGEYAERDYTAADRIIEQNFHVIAQMADDDDSEMSLEDLLELCRIAVLRHGCRVIIIDPWNELDHKREANETETDYTARAIRAMKRFARRYDVALWVVAHPAKPQNVPGVKLGPPSLYSISGSAHWANKPDYGFVVHRPDKESPCIDVHVLKVRMGYPGRMGTITLAYNWRESRYVSGAGQEGDPLVSEAA